MSDSKQPDFNVDRVIHEQARLMILTYLASTQQKAVLFTTLKQALDLTAGNLSVQLRNLETAGYVQIDKSIEGRKPVTSIRLTVQGYSALTEYITKMELIIKSVKNAEVEKS